MKVTLEGKSEEIQEILSFMHVQQKDYFAVKSIGETSTNSILNR